MVFCLVRVMFFIFVVNFFNFFLSFCFCVLDKFLLENDILVFIIEFCLFMFKMNEKKKLFMMLLYKYEL